MALIRLRVCAGWSEPLLVAHTTLLEISCHGSIIKKLLEPQAHIIEVQIQCTASVHNFLNISRFLFSKKMRVIRAGIHIILVRIVNREYPDQTSSLIWVCTVCLGL